MAKEIKKSIRITREMEDYIKVSGMNISENDVIKMIIFNDMKSCLGKVDNEL